MIDTVASSTAWPTSYDTMAAALDIRSSTRRCHGYGKKKPTCGNPVDKASISRIERIVSEIVLAGQMSQVVLQLLHELSSLVLCKSFHQSQASEKEAAWRSRLTASAQRQDEVPSSETSPDNSGRSAGKGSKVTVAGQLSPTRSQKRENTPQIPPQPPRQDQITNHATANAVPVRAPPSSLHGAVEVKPDPDPSEPTLLNPPRRRSPRFPHPTPSSLLSHTFQSYKTPLTTAKINATIKTLLLQPLTPDDQHQPGSIYGYSFPSTHTVSGPPEDSYIKIGFSKDVAQRMLQIATKCRYTPAVQFAFTMPHYKRMEQVVHQQLHNARRRETGCPGCRVQHQEWFVVGVEEAEAVVSKWCAWAATCPYKRDGMLKRGWAKRLKGLDMADEKCWERFIYGHANESGALKQESGVVVSCVSAKQGGKTLREEPQLTKPLVGGPRRQMTRPA